MQPSRWPGLTVTRMRRKRTAFTALGKADSVGDGVLVNDDTHGALQQGLPESKCPGESRVLDQEGLVTGDVGNDAFYHVLQPVHVQLWDICETAHGQTQSMSYCGFWACMALQKILTELRLTGTCCGTACRCCYCTSRSSTVGLREHRHAAAAPPVLCTAVTHQTAGGV